MSEGETGLRERKKRRTRETIVQAALRLFTERGFDATTIADIAAAADIAPRTFFGYFPSKEEVVFHDFEELFAGFVARLDERAGGETAFDAMRAWLLQWLSEQDPACMSDDLARQRLIDATPSLTAHERANLARFQSTLAQAVADDLAVPPDSLRPQLVAAAAVAALDALGTHHEGAPKPAGKEAIAILDEALVFLRGGLEALRRHPPT